MFIEDFHSKTYVGGFMDFVMCYLNMNNFLPPFCVSMKKEKNRNGKLINDFFLDTDISNCHCVYGLLFRALLAINLV